MYGICQKRELRKAMRTLRRKVSPDARDAYSAELCGLILEREDVKRAIAGKGTFAAYLASPDEIDLGLLIRRLWMEGCKVVVPAWSGETYMLADYSPDAKLVAGPMGILEPEAANGESRFAREADVSVWIVPGLAFSRFGARLGYGGGWYDRFLSKAASGAVSLGVAYPFQVVEHLPTEPHDLPLSGVVSANRAVLQSSESGF